MKLTIARTHSGTFEIHRAGCQDAKNPRKYDVAEGWDTKADSAAEVLEEIYPSSDFNYTPGTPDAEQYSADIHYAPCCEWELGNVELEPKKKAARKSSKMLVNSFFISFMTRPSALGGDMVVTVSVVRKVSCRGNKEIVRHYTLRRGSRSINRIQDLYSDDKVTLTYVHMPVYPTLTFVRNDKEL